MSLKKLPIIITIKEDVEDYSDKSVLSRRRVRVADRMWLTRSVRLVLYDNGPLLYSREGDKRSCSVHSIN